VTLAAGTRLGAYDVLALIGAGGMGEVYRARDPRLGRDVAIKVLPAGISADPDRLHRFEQEARSAAALNHPNILAVYDIGTHDGAPYIVSELLEGETLRERLTSASLPVRKAIEYAVQIAHGLAAAHEKGIVHRDLKPENIFVTADGRVKILDFGLAKLTQADAAVTRLSALPTTPPNTVPGIVLGTIGYMAPEQVRGLPADHRSDIFAFGSVLYEMLSGQRAFRGETTIDAMTAILKEDPPDLPSAERHIPPALARIVDRCLEKNPAARFKSADDLGFALETLSSHSDAGPALKSPAPAFSSSRFAPCLAALMFLSLALVLAAILFVRSPQTAPMVRFQIPPPAGGIFTGQNSTPRMAISPDGQYIAFTVNLRDGTPEQLWIRRLDALEARPLANTEARLGAAQPVQQPFWSPDSRHVGFFVDALLKKVDIASGAVQTVSGIPELGANYGGTWNRDGTILFGTSLTKGLQRVSADGGKPSQVTTLDASTGELAHLWPQFLPDERHFLYLAVGEQARDERAVYAGSIGSNERKRVLESAYMATFVPPGYLFFVRDSALMVQRFDVDALELQDESIQVADAVQVIVNGRAGFTVSDTGVLVYRAGSATTADSELAWFDRAGKQLGTVAAPFLYRGVELSPDGFRAAVHREERESTGDLWVLDLQRGSTSRFTFDASQHNMAPVWSPDGRRIFFSRNTGNTWGIYERDSTGVGAERLLHEAKGPGPVTPLTVSPDGQRLVFRANNQGDFSVLSLSSEHEASPYLQIPFNQSFGQLSPDGRWMAYNSNESGRAEVYVQSFPSLGTRYQVSTAGGTQPRWRGDGQELFYVVLPPSGAGTLMSVKVEATTAALRFGIPERLFDSHAIAPEHAPPAFGYSVTADGKRFLVARPLVAVNANPAETPLTVVLNWPSALRPR
jgi:serine/threonine protein kinase/Tol biopolymer transport system component